MTDFVDDLERELLAAAHRRSGRVRVSRRLPRVVLVAATLAAVLVAITVIARPAPDDHPVVNPPTTGPASGLPDAPRVTPSTGVVLVLNHTRQAGLASSVSGKLVAKLHVKRMVDSGMPVRRESVVVASTAQAMPLALRVGEVLDMPVDPTPAKYVGTAPSPPDVRVLVGTDRMR